MDEPITAYRPTGLPSIGNTMWPDGLPEKSSSTQGGMKMDYIDEHGSLFSICYTADQIKKYCIFSPFFPLLHCGPTHKPKNYVKPKA